MPSGVRARPSIGFLPDFLASGVETDHPDIAIAVIRGRLVAGTRSRITMTRDDTAAVCSSEHSITLIMTRATVAPLPQFPPLVIQLHDGVIPTAEIRSFLGAVRSAVAVSRNEIPTANRRRRAPSVIITRTAKLVTPAFHETLLQRVRSAGSILQRFKLGLERSA